MVTTQCIHFPGLGEHVTSCKHVLGSLIEDWDVTGAGRVEIGALA